MRSSLRLFVPVLALLTSLHAWGQNLPGCGQPRYTQQQRQLNPHLEQQADEMEERLGKTLPLVKQQVASRQGAKRRTGNSDPLYIIPVVVHVMHDNGPELQLTTPSRIEDAIAVLNRDFRKRNADSSQLDPAFAGLSIDSDIEFRLAKRDPQGRCHPGYNYVQYDSTAFGNDRVKSIIMWPRDRYLNVWVVRSIDGAGGYAILPQFSTSSNDGIVIRFSQFGPSGSNLAERSLTHECGHYLGLRHTWGPTNEPGLATNCNFDDGIGDTPNTVGAQGGCNKALNTCGPIANVENYMDYSDCGRMFTLEQVATMNNTLLQYSFRGTLWDPGNLAATGVAGTVTNCRPFLSYSESYRDVCVGQPTNFKATVLANASDPTLVYRWKFVGPTTINVPGDSVIVTFPIEGLYNLYAYVTNSAGQDSVVLMNGVRVRPANPVVTAPISWPFNQSPFSSDPAMQAVTWDVRSVFSPTFRHTVLSGGNGVIELPLSIIPVGLTAQLTSPAINMQALVGSNPPAYLYFDRAVVRNQAVADGQLVLRASTDCGETWRLLRIFRGSNNLYTTNTITSGIWNPTAADWKRDSVSLQAVSGSSKLLIRFDVTSGDGNQRMYLDNIRIGNWVVSNEITLQPEKPAVTVLPNPSDGTASIRLTLAKGGETQLVLTDVLGRQLASYAPGSLGAGTHELSLTQIAGRLARGVYNLHVQSGGTQQVVRLVIQ